MANNITSLGGQATLCGAIGYDFFGKEIERMAHRKGIKTDFVKTEQPTITKARIIGGRQQIVRIDYEQHLELSEKAREDFQTHLASLFQEFPTLVISDYGKGMISEELCSFLIKTAKSHGTRVIVDPKGQNWKKYAGADLITPNVKELGDIIGHPVKNNDQDIAMAALEIVHHYGLSALLVTRSEQGMSLISDQNILHLPTHSQEVFDVSGAGDTVVAALSLALTQGQEITEAMRIANVAAGIVVQKIGTATLSVEELNTNL
ncbi:MAG: bifunctional heptose 7-phosphate kinase/heptose 1-phosphate adenyltransferase [Butyricimonas faecihominis]